MTVTLRLRSVMWFTAGLVLALAMVWTSMVWRAEALPGPSESTVVNVSPERVLDTRDPVNLGLLGPFVSPVSQKLQITGSISTATGTKVVVPAGATGVLLNVTAVGPSADGFVSIRPGDATGSPTTSSLNVTAGSTVPNAVQVSLPTSGANAGKIDITYDALGTAGPTTDLLIDVVAYTTNAGLQDINTELGKKANTADVYTRTEVDTELGKKANTTDVDTELAKKANTADVYTRNEVDARGADAYATVDPDGTLNPAFSSFGTFTVTKGTAGRYSLTLPAFFGTVCTTMSPSEIEAPAITLSAFGTNTATVTSISVNGCPDPVLTAQVEVRDAAGTLTDGLFTFVAELRPPPATPRPPVSTGDVTMPERCTLDLATGAFTCE